MTHSTAKNFPIARAPRRIELLGDKTKRPESAQHIIEFPGGAIELSRTSDGNYWAHIIVNRKWSNSDQDGMFAALGEVVDARVDHGGHADDDLSNHETITQIAVLIRPVKP